MLGKLGMVSGLTVAGVLMVLGAAGELGWQLGKREVQEPKAHVVSEVKPTSAAGTAFPVMYGAPRHPYKVDAQEVEKEKLGNVVQALPVPNGQFLITQQNGPEEESGTVYLAAFQGTGASKAVSFGSIGYGNDPAAVRLTESDLFGESLIRFDGFLGAAAPVTIYFSRRVDFANPSPVLSLGMHMQERDLDGDGVKEGIASVGTLTETNLYKKVDGQVREAVLKELLSADSVVWQSETEVFLAYRIGKDGKAEEQEEYALAKAGFLLR